MKINIKSKKGKEKRDVWAVSLSVCLFAYSSPRCLVLDCPPRWISLAVRLRSACNYSWFFAHPQLARKEQDPVTNFVTCAFFASFTSIICPNHLYRIAALSAVVPLALALLAPVPVAHVQTRLSDGSIRARCALFLVLPDTVDLVHRS